MSIHATPSLRILATTTLGLGLGLLAAPLASMAAPIIKPDVSNARCKLIPPDTMAEYLRVHDVFFSAPGVSVPFKAGEVIKDQQPIKIEYKAPKDATLSYEIGWLGACGVHTNAILVLREEVRGSGSWSGIISTSTSGAEIPDGTPAVFTLIQTVAEPLPKGAGMFAMPKVKNTTVGEYTIRINPPKN